MNEGDEYYELVTFMITSARGLIDEPKEYAPARMMDSVEKLLKIVEKNDIKEYKEIREIIENENFFNKDEEELADSLDDLVEMLLE